MASASPASEGQLRLSRWDFSIVLVIISVTVAVLLPDLAHPGIHGWDEAAHQAATRSTLSSPLRPHIYEEHLSPAPLGEWLYAETWLHKPPLPYWLGGLVMRVSGVTPMALRSVSLIFAAATAVLIFLLARRITNRWIAGLAAISFGALPFGWMLVQGVLFGDAHDVQLAFWNTLATWAIVRTSESRKWRFAVLAGVAVALGYLTKSVLALTPLGVTWCLAAADLITRRWHRPFRGVSFRHAVGITSLAALGLLWDITSYFRFPELFRTEFRHLFSHIDHTIYAHHGGPWARPADAVFVELLGSEFTPLSQPTLVLAGLALVFDSIRRRSPVLTATSLWLWATWIGNSLMEVKVPAQLWGGAPAAMIALAALVGLSVSRPWLGLGVLSAVTATEWLPRVPWIPHLGPALPVKFHQLRTMPGIADSYFMTAVVVLVVWFFAFRMKSFQRISSLIVLVLAVPVTVFVAYRGLDTHRDVRSRHSDEMFTALFRGIGRTLDATVPSKSVLWLDSGSDVPGQFNLHSLMFWSGRPAYSGACNVPLSDSKQQRPIFVSARPQPLAVVASSPQSPFVAYDCLQPGQPPDIPPGLRAFSNGPPAPAGWGVSDVGVGVSAATFTVFLPSGTPAGKLHFTDEEDRQVAPQAILKPAGPQAPFDAWVSYWALGPRASDQLRVSLLPQ